MWESILHCPGMDICLIVLESHWGVYITRPVPDKFCSGSRGCGGKFLLHAPCLICLVSGRSLSCTPGAGESILHAPSSRLSSGESLPILVSGLGWGVPLHTSRDRNLVSALGEFLEKWLGSFSYTPRAVISFSWQFVRSGKSYLGGYTPVVSL